MSAKDEAVIANILKCLNETGIPLSKIAIQKAAYFLKAHGVPLAFGFEPYTYGPYSFALSRALDEMCFWDKISLKDKNEYSLPGKIEREGLSDELLGRIREQTRKFAEALDGDYEFNNFELLGTTLYCMKALENAKEPVSEETVVKEFTAWKGNAYTPEQIQQAFHKLQ